MTKGQQKLVVWDDRYSVAIPIVDTQHQELFNITNELYSACRQGGSSAKDRFMEIVPKVVAYVKLHFSTEETLMNKISYPYFPDHKLEHEDFVKRVLEEVRNFENGKDFVPNAFVRFLRDWIIKHIAVSDASVGRYITQLQRRGALTVDLSTFE